MGEKMKIVIACICAVILACASCASNPDSETGNGSRAGRSTGGRSGVSAAGGGAGLIPVEMKAKVLFGDGTLDEYTESEYDETFSTLREQRRYSASGSILEHIVYTYIEDKNLVKVKTTRDADDQIKNMVEYAYDGQGFKVSETLLTKDRKLVSSYSYVYDADGKLARRVFANNAGVKMAETVYSYDSNGNAISTETQSASGQIINTTHSQYNSDNYLTNQKVLNPGGQTTASTAFAWHSGRETKVEQFGPDGTLQMRITNEYGPDGELLKKTIEDIRGSTIQLLTYEYEFKPVK